MNHSPIVLRHEDKPRYIHITDLIRFLMILGVHDRGYPVSKFDDRVNWFQQTPNAKTMHL